MSPGTTPTQVARARMLEGMLLILCAHDLAQHRFGGVNPGLEIVAGRSREKCTGSKCSNAEGDNPFLHFESFPELMESLSQMGQDQGARRDSLTHSARAGAWLVPKVTILAKMKELGLGGRWLLMEEGANHRKKRSSMATSVRELLSPDLRCFWDKCDVEGDFQQEYGRTMVFSNLLARKKVIRMTRDRSLQA